MVCINKLSEKCAKCGYFTRVDIRRRQESDRRADMEKGEWWQRRRGPEESSVPDKELAQARRMGARKPHPSQVRGDFGRFKTTGLGIRVVPRLRELASRGQRESGGEIHAT